MAQRDPGDWHAARLRATRDLTHNIRLFEIEPESGFVAPQPGSHIDLALRFGARSDVRSYSTVGPCTDGVYRIAVKRLPNSRGGSAYMWTLPAGARLTIAPPANHFPLGRDRPEYLLVAGGIGITPIYGIALALADTNASFRLLYACRRPEDAALADELRARLGDRLELFVSDEGERIDLAAEIAKLGPGGELYVCGPIGMLDAAKHAWRESGRPLDLLRFETFGSSGRFAAEPFVVKIPRLGREIEVPADMSMLDALEAGGIEVIADCRKGECGLCALPIIAVDGVIDHRDVFFSEEEKVSDAKLCTCVSRVVGSGHPGTVTIDTADRPA